MKYKKLVTITIATMILLAGCGTKETTTTTTLTPTSTATTQVTNSPEPTSTVLPIFDVSEKSAMTSESVGGDLPNQTYYLDEKGLYIVDENGELIQEFPMDLSFDFTQVKQTFSLVDANFDGYKDISVLFSQGNVNAFYRLFLYDSGKNEFVEYEPYREISSPRIDATNKQIDSWMRASATDYAYSEMHWVEGNLLCYYQAEMNYDTNEVVYHEYDNAGSVITEVKKTYTENEMANLDVTKKEY